MNLRWLAALNVLAAGILIGRIGAGYEPIVEGPGGLPVLPFCFLITAAAMVLMQEHR